MYVLFKCTVVGVLIRFLSKGHDCPLGSFVVRSCSRCLAGSPVIPAVEVVDASPDRAMCVD